jgi:glycosyltransferase involved in cell wall biosynthesis
MRILICHNFYQQPGGEDQIFQAEANLLRRFGHDVETLSVHNDEVKSLGALKLAAATIWNRNAAHEVADRARAHRAQIVHFHNTFPLLSPAVYSAARQTGAAVVQTLHNYRLLCPSATMFRDGKPCEKCLGRLPTPAITHKCYRGSAAASAVAATMLMVHRALHTYRDQVDAFIVALTHFALEKFVQGGFDREHLHFKPNFLDPDPGPGKGDGNFALFVGRLTEEKGIAPMLDAWKIIGDKIPLKICGDGPLAPLVQNSGADWLGRRPLNEVIDLMGRAKMLIFPSLWYEGFPRTIVESFARGTPVVASDLGSMAELITTGRTGALFTPSDPQSLARSVNGLLDNPAALSQMRQEARAEFLAKFNPDRNHSMMLEIYSHALRQRNAIEEPELVAT